MSIQVINPFTGDLLEERDQSLVSRTGTQHPITAGAYRFVNGDNYTSSFGFQWNRFAATQIDRDKQGQHQSRERLLAVTGWDKKNLSGQNILEVGAGAGRFTQVVLAETKAELYSVDYSNAVEANFKNNGPHPRLHLFQASVYELPFSESQFDHVFCFGVLQHTPDFRKSIECLCKMVKPGGELMVDFYPIRGWYTKLHAKYLLRPITRRMSHERLLKWITSSAGFLIAAYRFFNALGVGRIVNRFLPICDIDTTLPRGLDEKTLREWVVLDTFDMFSPTHDHPQRLETVVRWFKESGMINVEGKVIPYGDNNTVTVVRGSRSS